MAKKVVFDSKTNRYGVCNALESLIIDKSIVNEVLPPLAEALEKKDVSLFLDPEIFSSFKAENCFVAKDEDYYEEYLGPSLSIKAVANIEEAIGHICQYGSDHTDGILAENQDAILEFVNRIDSSCVPVNASTRFNDGFELGLGAEMGISTSKLHAYGPMGLNELTTEKFVVYGNGQIKGNNC